MALRNEKEHSFRTLAIDLLEDHIVKLAKETIKDVDLVNLTFDSRLQLLSSSLNIGTTKLAIRWLENLDEKICPEVKSLEDQVKDRIDIDKEEPTKVIKDMVKLLESLK